MFRFTTHQPKVQSPKSKVAAVLAFRLSDLRSLTKVTGGNA